MGLGRFCTRNKHCILNDWANFAQRTDMGLGTFCTGNRHGIYDWVDSVLGTGTGTALKHIQFSAETCPFKNYIELHRVRLGAHCTISSKYLLKQ